MENEDLANLCLLRNIDQLSVYGPSRKQRGERLQSLLGNDSSRSTRPLLHYSTAIALLML